MAVCNIISMATMVLVCLVCLCKIIESEASHRRHDGQPRWTRTNMQGSNRRPSHHRRLNHHKQNHDSSHHTRKKAHQVEPNKPSLWGGLHNGKKQMLLTEKSKENVNNEMNYASSELNVRNIESLHLSDMAFAPAQQQAYNVKKEPRSLKVKTTAKSKIDKKKTKDQKKDKDKEDKKKKKKDDKKKKKEKEDKKKKKDKEKNKKKHKKTKSKTKPKTIHYKTKVRKTFHILGFLSILRVTQTRLPTIVPEPSQQGYHFESKWNDAMENELPSKVKDTIQFLSLSCKQRFKKCTPRNYTASDNYCEAMKSDNVSRCVLNNIVSVMNNTLDITTNNTQIAVIEKDDGCSETEWDWLETAACPNGKVSGDPDPEVKWAESKWLANAPLRLSLSQASNECRLEFNRCRKLYTRNKDADSYCGMLVSTRGHEFHCFDKTNSDCNDHEIESMIDAACTRSVVNWESGPWTVGSRLQLTAALVSSTCQKSLESCRVEADKVSYKSADSYCEMLSSNDKCSLKSESWSVGAFHKQEQCSENERDDLRLAACSEVIRNGAVLFKTEWSIILSVFITIFLNNFHNYNNGM